MATPAQALIREIALERAADKKAEGKENPRFFTTANLKKRGWTDSMLKKHLAWARQKQARVFGGGYYFLYPRGQVSRYLKSNPSVAAELSRNLSRMAEPVVDVAAQIDGAQDVAKRGRGRPRKHPHGTTATVRVAVSTAALVDAGGARKTFRLSPEAHDVLKMLMRLAGAPTTETAVIEQLLLAEKTRFLQSPTK